MSHSTNSRDAPPVGGLATGWLGLPRTFWFLWAGILVNRVGGAVFPFLAVYLTKERGLPVPLAGLVVGLFAAGGMLAGPLGGWLADRVGRRPILLVASTSAALVMLALGLAREPWQLVLIAPALGFFTDLSRPAFQAAIADIVPVLDRRRAYGLVYWAINLGFSGAAVLAGLMAEWSFTLLFVVDAVTTLAFGAIIFAGVPETRPADGVKHDGSGAAASLLAPLRDRTFVTFTTVQLLVMLTFQQGLVALPLDMRAHGLETSEIGRLLALNGIVIITLQPLFLRLSRRSPAVHVLAWGAALTGAGFGATALAGGVPLYAATIAVWTLGEIAFSVVTPVLLADLAPTSRRGVYQGTYQLAWGLAGTAAPLAGTALLGTFGSSALWGACLGAGGLAVMLHLTVTSAALGNRRRTADGSLASSSR